MPMNEMDGDGRGEATELLIRWRQGESLAIQQLFSMTYRELHQMAGQFMSEEREDHTLQTTALIHEAFLRLVQSDQRTVENRRHFFFVAARAMRQTLIERARARRAQKRAGDRVRVELCDWNTPPHDTGEWMLVLDEALSRMEKIDARKAKIAELRLFAGLTSEEIAAGLEVSSRTVDRDWRIVRAWLREELKPDEP